MADYVESPWSWLTVQPDTGGVWLKHGPHMVFVLTADWDRFRAMIDNPIHRGKSYDCMGFRKDTHLDKDKS